MSLGYFSGLSKAFLHVSIEIQARTRDRNLDQSLYGTCWLMNEFEDYSKTRYVSFSSSSIKFSIY